VAVGAWVVGLVLAVIAAWAAASRQASLNQAFRLMREQVEGELFPELAKVVAPGGCEPKEGNNAARTEARNAASVGLVCTDSSGWPAPACSRSAASWPCLPSACPRCLGDMEFDQAMADVLLAFISPDFYQAGAHVALATAV